MTALPPALARCLARALVLWAALWLCAAAGAQDLAARRGVLDVAQVPPTGVRLDGEWVLVRGAFLDPDAPLPAGPWHAVPRPWNAAQGAGALGFGTYALTVACPAGRKLALSVPQQRTALRLYVNGTLAARQGEPGATPQAARAAVGPRVAVTNEFACPLRVVAHVSNFDHRQGGLVRAPVAGEREDLVQDMRHQLAYGTLMLGGYASLALLSLFFFAARRKDPAPLYFALFCAVQATFADMMGERTLLLTFAREVPYGAYLRVEYLSWLGNMAAFLALAHRLFARDMRAGVVKAFLAAIGLAAFFAVAAPGHLASHVVPVGQALCVAMGAYITWAVAGAARRASADAAVMLGGLAFLLAVIVIDAALYNAGYWLRTLTPLGLLGFALAPGIVMARRLARALNAEELRVLEQKVRGDLLVRTTQAGIFDWDTTRDRRSYSPRLREMLGRPALDEDGQAPMFLEFVHPHEREAVRRQFEAALADRSTASGEVRHAPSEYRLLRADGGAVWVLSEAISLTGSDGATLRFICSFLDISGRRTMEEGLKASHDRIAQQAAQLRLQNAQLERDALLREDVERMSRHDLKTPLNSLIGVVRLLRGEPQLPPGARELLGIAERAGLRMLEYVNLSLDLLRMEQGRYAFRPQSVDLAALVGRVLVDTQAMAEAAEVRVVFEGGPARPVRGEELLCYSILANLVKNAIEASAPGGQVTIAFLPGERVRLRIHNAGELPAAAAARVFEKYFTRGKPGGTGLGAYTARLMARVQEGDLALESAPGQGVALVLSLQPSAEPAVVPRGEPAAGEGAAPLPQLAGRVLVVDDDEFSRHVLVRMLPPPLRVEVAVHGRAAVEAARREWPDAVLVDMEMPVMDGLEATRRLRAHQADAGLAACAVVMLSSNDDEASMRRAREAGADAYLVKPVTQEALLGTLARMLPAADAQPAAAPALVAVEAALADEVPAFLASRRELMQALARALNEQDRSALRSLAHQCHGGFAMWGFDWAAAQCRRMEQGAAHEGFDRLGELLQALQRHLDEVQVKAAEDA